MDGQATPGQSDGRAAAGPDHSVAAWLRDALASRPDRLAYREFDERAGAWRELTWRAAAARAAQWQGAIRAAGLRPGDRLAIMSRNCVDWVLADVAALGLGIVVVPLYREDRAENGAYILGHSGARMLIVEGPSQWERLAPLAAEFPALERVVDLTGIEGGADERIRPAPAPGESAGPFEVVSVSGDSLATIIYTSGTTGRPKGVMLSHSALRANAMSVIRAIPCGESDVFLSFLPLSHVLERVLGSLLPMSCGATVAFARSVPQLAEDLLTQRPTKLVSVPRVYERVLAKMHEQLDKKSPFARRLFEMTIATGWSRFERRQGRGPWRASHLLWPILDALVASKVRARLGGRLTAAACGSAPMSSEVARTFIGLGLDLMQGYGLTEAGGAVSANVPERNDPASVGPPIPGVEVRIGRDAELLVRGPSLMQGYWNDPAASKSSLEPDGWLHTGDQARIEDGFVYITGRLKEIIVLANGEKVPPSDMELAVCGDPLFEHALVLGEGRPYLSALVVLNGALWVACAREAGVADPADLRAADSQRVLVERIGARLSRFPGYAQVRRVAATTDGWNVDNGMLTPTMKLRRTHVLRQYSADIAWLYEGH